MSIKANRGSLTELMLVRFAKRNSKEDQSVVDILFDIAQDKEESSDNKLKATSQLSRIVYPTTQSVEQEIIQDNGLSQLERNERISMLLNKNPLQIEEAEYTETQD